MKASSINKMVRYSKILVIGGYGFIGAYIARALSKPELNNKIVVYDRNTGSGTTGNDLGLDVRNNINIMKGSILNPFELVAIGQDFDYIIHAAGFLGIHNVAEHMLLNMDINVLGTKNCLELAKRQKNLKKYIQFSTSEIYGVESLNTSENHDSVIKTVGKRWCYAASKLAGEYYLKAYVQDSNINAAIVRPFNVYGPYRYGSNAMTTIIGKALKNEPIEISGNGKQTRSWCHIDDFCDGIFTLLSNSTNSGEAFNLGDDRYCISMIDLAAKVVRLTGSSSGLITSNDDAEDVQDRKPNIDKARNLLSYLPSKQLDDGILEVAAWLKSKSKHTLKVA